MAALPAPLTSRYDQAEIVNAIRQTVCKGASDAQLRMFLEVCKETGLDPFLKEIYFVAEKSIIMASRDGYLRKANEHPMFDGMETRVERDNRNVPIKATCSVWRKDRSHAVICEAFYSEYKKPGSVWSQYPSAMISKVAEVLALKRSFSINGVVTEEEIGTERSNVATMPEPKVIREPPGQFSRAGDFPPANVGPQPAAELTDALPEFEYEEVELPEDERSQLEQELADSITLMGKRKEMLDAFGVMKNRYAAVEMQKTFYGILKLHGVGAASEFKPTADGQAEAVACFAEMRLDIARREGRR